MPQQGHKSGPCVMLEVDLTVHATATAPSLASTSTPGATLACADLSSCLAHELQSWAVGKLDAARYIVWCSEIDKKSCSAGGSAESTRTGESDEESTRTGESDEESTRTVTLAAAPVTLSAHAARVVYAAACIVAGKPKRRDNVRTSLQTTLQQWALTTLHSRAVFGPSGSAKTESGVLFKLNVGVDAVARDLQHAACVLRCATPSAAAGARAGSALLLKGWTPDALRLAGDDNAVAQTGARGAAGCGPVPPPLAHPVTLRWVPRSKGMSLLRAYMTLPYMLSTVPYRAPHFDVDGAPVLCPPSKACPACCTYSCIARSYLKLDMRAVLRLAMRDGYDVSALYDTRAMEELHEALLDWFKETFFVPSAPGEDEVLEGITMLMDLDSAAAETKANAETCYSNGDVDCAGKNA
jgi:hypothetical protein